MSDFEYSAARRENESSLVATESQSFVKFDRWMDDELDRLVACWIHTAAPNALRLNLVLFSRRTQS